MTKSEKTGSEQLGQLIRARRQALGLRRRDLVELTGLSYPYVSQIETGYRLPSDRAVRDLATALQLDAAELTAVMPADRQSTSLLMVSSPTTGGPDWHTNPDYAAGPPDRGSAVSAPPSRTGIVTAAVQLLEQLSPDDRLDALSQVQRELLEGLVNESTKKRRR
jgi:transcriptional regulator with XRE-family HTH domain